ncbi:MAG: hypothetical protein M0D57_19430 [Sphingobacteriales bacterium JAD_PAG50586_3]|nr:MAG: hypothetical protein M0D57_19430 [Sphingobacteriales bacterium JAD_PAG50586_3]
MQWGLIISLWFAHNFIEFFGFCRGYGMSMALLVAALYYTALFIKQPNTRLLLWALFFNAFMLLANLSLFNTFALINLALGLVCFLNYKQISTAKAVAGFVLLSAIPGVYLVRYMFELKARGLLYYGTTEGFIKITLGTVSELVFSTREMPVLYFIIGFFYLLILYLVYKFKDIKQFFKLQPVDLFAGLLLGNVVIIYFLAAVMQVNYPEDRVGMYLYPLFVLAAFFIVDVYQSKLKYALLIPVLYIPLHFVYTANITHSKVWAWEHIPRSYFNRVLETPTTNGYPPIVSGYKMRTLTWAYFNMRKGARQNQIQETDFRDNLYADFIITRTGEVKGIDSLYTKLDYDEPSGLGLYKRKVLVTRTPLLVANIADKLNTIDEYTDFCKLALDTLAMKNLLFEVDCKVKVLDGKVSDSRLVIDIISPDKKSVAYYYQQLDWLYGRQPNGEYNLKHSFVIPATRLKDCTLVAYYWNIGKQPVNFTGGRIKVYTVE